MGCHLHRGLQEGQGRDACAHWAAAEGVAAAKRQREEAGHQPGPKRRPIVEALVAQHFNPKEMRQVVEHPCFAEAMRKAAAELGTCGETLTRAAFVALPLAADIGVHLPPIEPRRQAADMEGDGPARKRNQLGELKSAAKVANSEARLRHIKELEQQQRGQADQQAARTAAFARVNTVLHRAGCIDDDALAAKKKPTVALMKRFIEQYPSSVVPAWRLYAQKHGVGSGSTIAWKYYFDFVYGGYNYHPTLKEGHEALPLVLDDQKTEGTQQVIEL